MCLAVPGRVLELVDRDGLRCARVDFGGVRKEICLETTPEAVEGDWVLVHVGFALRVLDEAAAREIHVALGRASPTVDRDSERLRPARVRAERDT